MLRRKTPLRRTPFKYRRRVRLRSRSIKRAAQERIYRKQRKHFLAKFKWCAVMRYLGANVRANQIHHAKGREGELLNDVRWWLPVCAEGHQLIHRNVGWARQIGFLLTDSQERKDKPEWYTKPNPFCMSNAEEAIMKVEGLNENQEIEEME